MLTYAQKKYLFAIYRLGMNGPVISSSDVSRLVGVSKASTVKMTQRLISLTESGIKAASSLFTSSVILCDFLHKQVGIDQQEADQDAVKIVAQVSEKSVEKLVKFALGDAANA